MLDLVAPLFRFEAVTVQFGAVTVLGELDLEVADQGITILTGPSGAGKTTLLRLCNRLEVPTRGTVAFRGRSLDELDPLVLRRRVGMVFQRPVLFPGTVRDNLHVAQPDADDAALVDALGRADLPSSFLGRVGDELSGGEAQRMCLARTLVTSPEALLVDEPTSSLDSRSTSALERSISELAAEGVPVVWVTHDRGQARRMGDRHVVLTRDGLLPPEQVQDYVEDRT
ncbi:MAG: ATP-binding cassette domain-containing protein [Acidimicrobiia bacterium]|nr:ATP-binding cassette domain-containing protein [Acidimicrobiia bacterium]